MPCRWARDEIGKFKKMWHELPSVRRTIYFTTKDCLYTHDIEQAFIQVLYVKGWSLHWPVLRKQDLARSKKRWAKDAGVRFRFLAGRLRGSIKDKAKWVNDIGLLDLQ
eukprot:6531889-Heterocapsa_arctica.AAC.1